MPTAAPLRPARRPLAALAALVTLLALPGAAGAQPRTVRPVVVTAEDSMTFARAQRLVSEGAGPAGRRLVDSVLAGSPEGSPRYAEALFWRGALAASAADAERDYRRLWIEFPLSPRAADALVRLAQLELARGDRDLAMRHLERLARDHATSPALPRASYWMARVLFEANDVARACDALATARATAPAGDVELRNQVAFYARRCDGVTPAPVAAGAAPTPAPAAPTTVAAAPAPPRPAARQRPAAPVSGSAPVSPSTPVRELPAVDTVPAPTGPPPVLPRPRVDSAAVRRSARADSIARADSVARLAARPARPERPAPATPAGAGSTPASTPAGGDAARYSIQVAAYDTERAARDLAARLATRGLDAHVVAGQGFYRVRVGRYETRAAAMNALRDLRARRIEGYVVP